MSHLDALRDARRAYSVSYMAFIKIVTVRPNDLVCFFEGKDIKYYGPRLNMLRADLTWQPIDCGGKDSVVRLYFLISEHEFYRNANVAFFIDKDYELSIAPVDARRIYCTPCYSIENLYASRTVFEEILQGEFGLERMPDEEGYFSRCVDLFLARLNEFLEAAVVLDTWIFVNRYVERRNHSGRLLNVEKLKMTHCFEITLSRVRSLYTVFDLETQSECTTPVSEQEFSEFVNRVAPEERRSRFRGKFLLFFVRTFIQKLADDASRSEPLFFSTTRRSLRPSERNCLSELSQYAETPNCLRTFLNQLVNTNN